MSARRHAFTLVFAACLAATVLPLWMGRHLPAVDAPQHLFLIHVLGHLDDPALPFGEVYQARPGLTYLTAYYGIRALAALGGVERALQVWLTLVILAIPLSLLALLKALNKSPWLALLACPLAYTDNFYWGLVSFLSALPLTLLSLACFAMALEAPAGSPRSRWATLGSAASLFVLQLTHAAAMILPALALPLLLATTPSDGRRRARALASLTPGVALFLGWLLSGVNRGRQMGAPGEPWRASAPLFHRENFTFHPLSEKVGQFPELLSNGFWGWADRPAIWAVAGAAALALSSALLLRQRGPPDAPRIARLRPLLLFGLALTYYLLLPMDVNGYMYSIYPRYAQVAALLAIPALPFPRPPLEKLAAAAAALVSVYSGGNLAVLFQRFDAEAENFEVVARALPRGARVMHLVTDWSSRHATHAVYLHYAALAALRAEGVPSFSLAIDPSFPVGYRQDRKPPAAAWEWHPERFSWTDHALWYDYFLARGDLPAQALFGAHAADVELAARADRWQLYKRRSASP